MKETLNFIYLGNFIEVSMDNSDNVAHGLHPIQVEKNNTSGLVLVPKIKVSAPMSIML